MCLTIYALRLFLWLWGALWGTYYEKSRLGVFRGGIFLWWSGRWKMRRRSLLGAGFDFFGNPLDFQQVADFINDVWRRIV